MAIGRALANAPPIVLANKPTASLGTERGMKVIKLLKKIARERHAAVFVVTHDERMIAGADTVLRLKDGRLNAASSAQDGGAVERPIPEPPERWRHTWKSCVARFTAASR